MNKNMRYVAIMMVGLLILGCVSFFKNLNSTGKKYEEYIELANKAYKKEIYVDAVDYYEDALEVEPSHIDTYIKLANSYMKLGNSNQYESVLKKAIDQDDTNAKPYVALAEYYASSESYDKSYEILRSATNVKDKKQIKKLQKEYSSYYKTYGGTFTDIKQWKDGFIAVKDGELWGLIDNEASESITPVYNEIGAFDEDESVTPVKQGNEWYYIDKNGYKKLVGDHSYDYLGSFCNGYAPASYKGKYGWIDREFEEYHFEYDDVTPFKNGVAAAKKGKKWALINTKFKAITDFKYSNVKLDENDFCSSGGIIFAKQSGKYIMLNTKGKRIGNLKFDDAKPFVTEQYAAVKKGKKWGYVDDEGKLVIKYKYNDAKSFANGVAGVKEKSSWGLINQNGKEVVDSMFDDIGSMNSKGTIFVKNANIWQCIGLYAYMNCDD